MIIQLPFTCKQITIFFVVLFHFFIPFSHFWVYSLGESYNENLIWMPLMIAGYSGVICFWSYKMIMWDLAGKLPKFKCRCSND